MGATPIDVGSLVVQSQNGVTFNETQTNNQKSFKSNFSLVYIHEHEGGSKF